MGDAQGRVRQHARGDSLTGIDVFRLWPHGQLGAKQSNVPTILSVKFARLGLDRPAALVIWTIIIGTCIRFILAAAEIDVGHSEAYYVATARHFALSYFDHPPLSLWITWATLQLTGSDRLIVLRAPYIAMFAATTWLMYRLGAALFHERAGAFAGLLLNLVPLFTLSVGAWVEPDGPLMFFLLATTLCVVRLAFGPPTRHCNLLWALAGLLFGLAMLAKYYAVLVALGLAVFSATSREQRHWFLEAGPYLASAVAFAVFSPVLIWNWRNGWVSFNFQGGRVLEDAGLQLDSFFDSILGQAGVIGPWIWLPLIHASALVAMKGPKNPKSWFLFTLGAAPVLLFTTATLWVSVSGHFHWQAPGYLLLLPLLGHLTAEKLARDDVTTRRWLLGSTIGLVLAVAILGVHATTGWLRIFVPNVIAKSHSDPTLKGLAWTHLRSAMAARDLLGKPRLFGVTANRDEIGKVDLELGRFLPVVCLCPDPRNIAFGWNHRDFLGWDALLVGTDDSMPDIEKMYGVYFRKIEPLQSVDIRRGDQTVLTVRIYYATDYRRLYPLPLPLTAR